MQAWLQSHLQLMQLWAGAQAGMSTCRGAAGCCGAACAGRCTAGAACACGAPAGACVAAGGAAGAAAGGAAGAAGSAGCTLPAPHARAGLLPCEE